MLPRRALFIVFSLAGLASLSLSLWAQPRRGLQPAAYAITDARIITEPGKELPKASIVIRDGIVQAVGADVAAPADAIVIDGKGLVVYPGFIDAGSSWGIDLALRRSETGPPEAVDYAAEALAATKLDNRKGVTPEFDAATALQLADETADNWRKQGITARLAFPDGGILSGQSALVSLSGAAPREAVIRSPIALHAALRPAAVGGFGGGPGNYPSTLMGVMAHVRQTLLDAGWAARLSEAYEKHGIGRRPPHDPALAALLPALEGKERVVFEANSRDEIHRALDLAAEFHLKPLILGGAEAWKVADRLQAENVPLLLTLNFPEQPRTLTGGGRRGPGRPTPPADPATPSPVPTPGRPRRPEAPMLDPTMAADIAGEEGKRPLPKRVKDEQERKQKEEIQNPAVLHQKGILFAFIGYGIAQPDKFRENLRKAITEGLPAEAALQALTVNAARILGAEKQLGTIAPGKAAHLVAMTGDLQDAKAQVRYVFADGVRFEYEPPKADDAKKPADGKPGSPKGDKPADPTAEAKADDKKPDEKKADEKKRDEKKADEKKAGETKTEPATEIDEDRKPKIKTGGNVLLKGGTILTVTNGTVKGDLLVLNGKIAKVGPDLAAPANVTVLDMAGMYVMPGIIDTHCHFAMSGGVNEFTLSVVPEVSCRDIINSEDVQIYRALAGGVTTARLLHGSANVIGGQDAVIKLKYGEPTSKLLLPDAPRGVKFALGENVKRSDGRFPNTRLGVEAVLVRAFTEAQAYKQARYEYQKARNEGKDVPEPRRDLRLEALADILDGKLFIHCHCYRADEILMLLRVADRFGFKVKSLQHVLEGYKIAPEIAAHGASCSTFSDWWAYKIEAYDAIPYNAALLQEAGAVVCMKSDSNELMRHLYQEAAKAMKYGGLSEADALKTITLNGARQLGLDKRIGSIEEGKDADLAVFTAHPLSSYARCDLALVNGEVYFQRASDLPRSELPAFTPPAGKRGPEVVVKDIERNPKGKYIIHDAIVHITSDGPSSSEGRSGYHVYIDGGKLTLVAKPAPGSRVEFPADATVIDGQGLHVYPGMIDAGTVVGLTELGSARETQDYAEGGDFQPDLRAAIGVNPDSELIPVTRANGVLTVVTRPGGATIAGQSALLNLFGWVPQEMVVVDPLTLHIEFPTAAMGGFGMDPNVPMMGRAIARKQRDEKLRKAKDLFKQAVAYDHARAAGGGRVADPRLEALVPYAKGEKPVIIQANRKDDITEALKFADDLKLKMILSGGIDAWKVADELKKRDIPVIVGPVMAMPQEAYDPYDAPYACAAKLHEAGVKFCIRSGGSTNTRNLPYEAAMCVSYGLPPDAGLKAVTLYPAQILGVADRLGSIERGKIANLVLTDGDILQATTQVHAIFINGTPLEPTSKQTRLYERYRQRLSEVKEGKARLGTK